MFSGVQIKQSNLIEQEARYTHLDTQNLTIIHTYTNTFHQKKTDIIKVGEQQLKITIEIFWVFSSTGSTIIVQVLKSKTLITCL